MKSNKKAYIQLFCMLSLTVVTQLVTIVKSSLVASIFGTSVQMDAYNFVNNIASFLFCFIGVGVSNVLIPAIAKKNVVSTRSQNGFLTILYGTSLALLALVILFRRPLLGCFSGYTQAFIDTAASLMAVLMLGQFLNAINWVSLSYLQCRDCYTPPKIISLAGTVALTVLVFCHRDLTIAHYAAFSFGLILLEVTGQYWLAIRKGFRYRPCAPLRDPELWTMFRTFLPTVWGTGVYQLTLLTDSLISSTLGTGSLSVLSYSNTISGMVNTVIASNVMLYIYPRIAAEANDEKGKKKLFQYMVLFAAMMFLVVVLFFAAGYDAVRILFERGRFNTDATQGVFVCVLIYLLGAPINIMRDVVYRYFYSKGNTRSTFRNGLSASILNMVISIILAQFMGLYGIVLGTTITAVFSFTSILLRMRKHYTFGGNFPFFARELTKVLAATVLAVLGCVLVKALPLGWPSLAVSVLAAVLGMLIFGAVLLLCRSKVFQVELG